MAEAGKILRKTIHTLLSNYHVYASVATLLVFPTAASVLFSQAIISLSPGSINALRFRLQSVFSAAGFPASLGFFSLLTLKLSQTICSITFTVPFTLTFLILAKAAITQIFFRSRNRGGLPSFRSIMQLYIPLVRTYVGNYFTIHFANAAVFCLLFVAFNVASLLQVQSSTMGMMLSLAGGITYSIVLANVVVACNLAVVISGLEERGGCLQILKAFLLIKGRTSTALSLAVPTNLGMAAIEALFQYRVVKIYNNSSKLQPSTVWEALTIAYLYSMLLVIDTIATCMFLKSCKLRNLPTQESEIYLQANELLEIDTECYEPACNKC